MGLIGSAEGGFGLFFKKSMWVQGTLVAITSHALKNEAGQILINSESILKNKLLGGGNNSSYFKSLLGSWCWCCLGFPTKTNQFLFLNSFYAAYSPPISMATDFQWLRFTGRWFDAEGSCTFQTCHHVLPQALPSVTGQCCQGAPT